MNSRSLQQLIANYADRESLTTDQCAELSESMSNNSSLVHQLIDDRAVDGMLSLISSSKSEEDEFVSQCLNRISSVEADTDNQESGDAVLHDEIVIDVGSVTSSRIQSKKTGSKPQFSLQLWGLNRCEYLCSNLHYFSICHQS